jgi:hypothetical protein
MVQQVLQRLVESLTLRPTLRLTTWLANLRPQACYQVVQHLELAFHLCQGVRLLVIGLAPAFKD